MSSVVATMSITLDGVAAGGHVTEEHPFGDLPQETFFRWMDETPEENRAAFDAIVAGGAYIMGRNMFGPITGPWTVEWNGWWGPNPPYHAPVFVLTHHPRASVVMEGGTVFHFVTDGIVSALERAKDAAGERPVHIAGGPSTTNAYLAAGLVDELYLNVNPVVAGRGLRLFDGVGPLRLDQLAVEPKSLVTHFRYRVVRDG
ncbi:dihydrofolate reductase family protein [Microbacterium sp. ASV49]|uniref:Dihydrofolate reductase family protein n=1 Tax=Microbacterium candidum TaxID=3041922 RepID=A0ABT7MYW8_9MICO|nr:dihydrofolate reductase family protein [Microbacterium sp. ASV49]MDL9979622.1 dihydrofolate reductase family protein [Microbacterium sp. ASV49]